MKIAVSSSFEQLMKRVDCEVFIVSCYLAKLDQNMPEESSILSSPKKDVEIGACGIWEKDTKKLKLYVRIPEDSIADSTNINERQKYAAIYFFSSREDQGGATFAIYDYSDNAYNDLGLSIGRNLIDIDFPDEFVGRISLKDTSKDTEFLETFGQYPGKNIQITGDEDIIVSKKTYYQYWRLEVTKDRKTTDLPLLDEYGKMVVSNYRYRTYSNLIISTPSLLRNFNPPTRFGLSDSGGTVSILGTADFIEYSVWGDTIKEELRGKTTIDSIPGSEIVYVSGHDDFGNVVNESQNIFSIDNYSSLIDYSPKDTTSSYGADGIFELRVTYYDVKEKRPVTIVSENRIQLARRDKSDSWFIIDSSTEFTEYTEEFGNVPVYLFPYDTQGTEFFTIRTKFPVPISDLSQVQLFYEDPTIESLFSVSINLEPFVDQSGVYYVDIKVNLKALTENTNEKLWAPIIENASKLIYTKISYQDYFEVFYMVQCPKIEGETLRLVDSLGNTVNEVVLNYGAGSNKTYYLVADPETTDLGERNGWRIIRSPQGINYSRTAGLLSSSIQDSYAPENSVRISYAPNSDTAQDIILPDIIVARLKEQGISEDLENTSNWRIMVDIVQIHVGFRKIGETITVRVSNQIETGGIGLYGFTVKSNCRFTIKTEDTRYIFKEKWIGNNGNPLNSPSYSDSRYISGGNFEYWIQKNIVNSNSRTTLSPIIITAEEGDRQLTKTVVVNQDIVPFNINKLNENGEYLPGSWGSVPTLDKLSKVTSIPYKESDWIKQSEEKTVSVWDPNTRYNKGDIVKWFVGYNTEFNGGDARLGRVYANKGEWWLCIVGTPQDTPSFSNNEYKNVTQMFISISDNNLGNPITSDNQNTGAYWKEVSITNDLYTLNNRKINIASVGWWNNNLQYSYGDIVRRIVNGIYHYYIAIAEVKNISNINFWNIAKEPDDPDNPGWWKDISNCSSLSDVGLGEQLDGAFYRTVFVKSVNIPYTYTKCCRYILEEDNEDKNYSIQYLLDNPDKFTPGISLENKLPSEDGTFYSGGYIFIMRDSNWVELNRIDDLTKILGDMYSDKYFYDNSNVFQRSYFKELVNRSVIYPSSLIRQVYLVSEYSSFSNLSDISIESIPYIGSINNLPSPRILPRYSSNYRRVEDGGIIRLAKLNEDLTKYRGEWSNENSYLTGDIVSIGINTNNDRVYYKASTDISADHSPIARNNTEWILLTWTRLDPTTTIDDDSAINNTMTELNMRSNDGIRIIPGTYQYPSISASESYRLFRVTKDMLQREPVPGEIIKMGNYYYYCGVIWDTIDCPNDGTLDSLSIMEISNIGNRPLLLKGYISVIFKYNDLYYVNNSNYIFNNVGYNRYLFVPKYSNSSTQIKFFSRKTPTETLSTRDTGTSDLATEQGTEVLIISNPSYPMFDETSNENQDHYLFHVLGLRYDNTSTQYTRYQGIPVSNLEKPSNSD